MPIRLLVLCCGLLAGCAGGSASRDLRPAQETALPTTPAISETAFAVPSGYPAALAAAATATAPPALPEVEGLRLGRHAGIEALLVETPLATAAIALHGGHLLSYVPAGQEDALWLSPSAKPPPDAIRGGTPVVWPYFGRQGQTGEVPAHGFVRTVRWQVLAASRADDGSVAIELAPPDFPELGLQLRMTLRIGQALEQTLATTNTGVRPVAITQALHTYFRVSDVAQVRVRGLDGLSYLDKNDGYAAHAQAGDWTLDDPRDPGRSDYIYTDAPGRYVLDDPGLGRRIALDVAGSRSLVVWNPGATAAARMDDIGQAWRGFLCLEAANAGPDVVALAPGATHRLTQTVRVLAGG